MPRVQTCACSRGNRGVCREWCAQQRGRRDSPTFSSPPPTIWNARWTMEPHAPSRSFWPWVPGRPKARGPQSSLGHAGGLRRINTTAERSRGHASLAGYGMCFDLCDTVHPDRRTGARIHNADRLRLVTAILRVAYSRGSDCRASQRKTRMRGRRARLVGRGYSRSAVSGLLSR